MTLRHPVVITSLEEDFKKIGLLKEDEELPEAKGKVDKPMRARRGQGMSMGKTLPKSRGGEVGSGRRSSGKVDQTDEDDMDMEYEELAAQEETENEVAAYAEALEFAEAFARRWDLMEGEDEFILDEEEMEELEALGESVELDGGVLDEEDEAEIAAQYGMTEEDDDEEDDEDEDDEEDDDDEEMDDEE